MEIRRRGVLPALLCALLLCALPAPLGSQEAPSQEQPPAPPVRAATADLEGRPIPVSVAMTARGPLVSLEPVAAALPGRLETGLGPARTLLLEDERIVLAPGSDAITVGTDIVRLSQPPIATPEGLLVPLDLLAATYGDLLGYRFDWDAAADRLWVRRPEAREVPVSLDLVHLQGVTTLVLQFPERPRYEVETRPGRVEVELLGTTVVPESQRSEQPDDPLVRRIDVGADRVVIELAAGAEASSYTLERPFRLVLDVHRRSAAAQPPPGIGEDDELEPPQPREGVRTIVIDPGHGGGETGAVGPSGTEEKELTLLLARALEARLESRLPVKVVLTRTEDAHLPLDTRAAVANQNKADLFLSIHLNAAAGSSARGAETYFLSLAASDARAAEAAEAENQAGGAAPADDPLYDLQLILWDLAQSHHLAESQAVARLIQEELNGALGLRDRGVKQAPFRVLMGAAMPAVLVELGFLSNAEEEERLLDPAYRAELVDALVRAITRYRAQVLQRTGEAEPGGETAAASETEAPGGEDARP